MINKNFIENIADFNFWQKEQEIGFERSELRQVMPFVDDTAYALMIAGIRRAGKTFLCRQIIKEKIKHGVKPEQTLYINFEDPILEPYLAVETLSDFYESYRYFINKQDFAYIVLDEVQNVPKWEKWVRIMLEKKEKVKFIITGSSSKFYKGAQSRVLTGRGFTFTLFPLSFSDFLRFKQYSRKRVESYASIAPLLTEYIEFGGFPLIVLEEDKEKKKIYLKELFDDIVVKDIVIKHKLRELEIKKLAVILLNQFASLVSVRRSQELLKEIARTTVSPTSINNYLEYMAGSFLFFFLPIFSYKIKEVLRYPKKGYSADTGFINALTLRFSENIGRLYENLTARMLVQKYGSDKVFYWKHENKEVDFIVKQGNAVTKLIQVSFDIKKKETREREVQSLLTASEELKCGNLTIITRDTSAQESIEKKAIAFVPLWEWLLGEDF